MPLYDNDEWLDYIRSFPDEPEEHSSAPSLAMLEEFLEEIEVHPRHIKILLLAYCNNLTHHQIADSLNIVESVAMKRFQTALDEARKRSLLFTNLEEVKQQPYCVRMFIRHLFMW